jgi:hypothetical protein
MGKIFKALAMATAVCWPATVLAASDGDVPGRGMSKAEVRAQFGQPRHTLHSVREKQRAPAAEPSPAGGAPGEQPQTHSTLEAEVGVSPANGEEPPTEKEEQETNIEVETFEPPRNKEEEDDETSTESDSAPGSTAVRANAEGSEERSEEDTERDARENTDDGASDEGRFRFDPATGRIVVDDPQEDEDSDASPAR